MQENVNQQENQQKELRQIKMKNIIYPIIIGLGVVGYMIYKDFSIEAFQTLSFDFHTILWLIIAGLFMFGRDIGYIIRIKVLSDGKLSWWESFRIIMLWEFTSAITPSAIGGTSFAIIYVHKGGISVGRSSAIVLLTSFLDELYFVVMFPILFLLLGYSRLFDLVGVSSSMQSSIFTFFMIGYGLKLAYTLFISYGLFVKPRGLKWIIVKIFSIRFLRKWRNAAVRTGDDIIVSSGELRKKKVTFWLKVLGATFLSWSSRYLVVNAIIIAFFAATNDHLLLFARQFVMWVMMLVMPTPGGSGFSEFFFAEYLGEFFPVAGVAIIVALIWRLITYYPYLIIGVIVFPRWLRAKFPIKVKKKEKK